MNRSLLSARYPARLIHTLWLFLLLALAAEAGECFPVDGDRGTRLDARPIARFDEPWAMTFLPDGDLLVTEQAGTLWLVTPTGDKTRVAGVPSVAYGGQGGLGDVIAAPDFADSQRLYLSYVASDNGGRTRGAVVASARLDRESATPALRRVTEIWRQQPFVTGRGHFSHRLAIGPAGTPVANDLFITSGERQKQTPAQSLDTNLGKIIRLNADGSLPDDANPFAEHGGTARQVWSMGHRNMLGLDFDTHGQLWAIEMGPRHGDELNRIERGHNYGWPIVSEGDHYSGAPIADHATRPDLTAPAVAWVPSIAPAGLTIYKANRVPNWQNDAFIGGLVAQAIVRVDLDATPPREVERYGWQRRVRELETGPDGALWVLEDGHDARLLRMTPAS